MTETKRLLLRCLFGSASRLLPSVAFSAKVCVIAQFHTSLKIIVAVSWALTCFQSVEKLLNIIQKQAAERVKSSIFFVVNVVFTT